MDEVDLAAEAISTSAPLALACHVLPDGDASAVLVYRLARRLGWPLTREAAICLYTGIVTDTGRFQYSNTTPEVFAMANDLARYDLPIAAMTRQLFEEHRFAYLKLVAL